MRYPASVEVEEFTLGELRHRVLINRGGQRTLWERYATHDEAVKGKGEAEAYLKERDEA